MERIILRKEPDGWRAYVLHGDKMSVLDDFFEDELEATEAATALSQ